MPAEDHLEGRDVDAEFAAIIAGWDLTPDLSSIERDTGAEPNADAPAAVAEDSAEPGSTAGTPAPATGPASPELPSMPGFPNIVSAVPVPSPAPRPQPVEREVPPPGAIESSLDEHFVPDPVELPPQEDLHFWGIVVGLVAGPLLLLWALLFGEGHSHWWTWIGAALTLGGFALLVLRQPTERDEDDDGARV
jgi:hypothetical protein